MLFSPIPRYTAVLHVHGTPPEEIAIGHCLLPVYITRDYQVPAVRVPHSWIDSAKRAREGLKRVVERIRPAGRECGPRFAAILVR